MTDYMIITYEYLRKHDILDAFIEANDIAPNSDDDDECSGSPINSCIYWDDSPQGQEFWYEHESNLEKLLYRFNPCTVGEFLEYINNITNEPTAYEFW